MSEVVWVALISAGVALVTALATQFLATRAASRQADRADRREALQWQRSEASRQEAAQRDEAQRLAAVQDARLRELWGHVLTARWQILDALERVPVQGSPASESARVSAQAMPVNAAGQAYCVALTGLAAVRPSAKEVYAATSRLQLALLAADGDAMARAVHDWNGAYQALEVSVAALADGLVDKAVPGMR